MSPPSPTLETRPLLLNIAFVSVRWVKTWPWLVMTQFVIGESERRVAIFSISLVRARSFGCHGEGGNQAWWFTKAHEVGQCYMAASSAYASLHICSYAYTYTHAQYIYTSGEGRVFGFWGPGAIEVYLNLLLFLLCSKDTYTERKLYRYLPRPRYVVFCGLGWWGYACTVVVQFIVCRAGVSCWCARNCHSSHNFFSFCGCIRAIFAQV